MINSQTMTTTCESLTQEEKTKCFCQRTPLNNEKQEDLHLMEMEVGGEGAGSRRWEWEK